MIFKKLFLLLTILVIPEVSWSHPGGLNSSGCHGGSKPYHCHRSASEMVPSSSGGSRLKCSADSQSKDCSTANNQSVGQLDIVQTNNVAVASNELQAAGDAPNEIQPDGVAITLFGFNFDLTVGEAKATLTKRFGCGEMMIRVFNSCVPAGGGTLVSWNFNDLGEIEDISFGCATFNGCTYPVDEVVSKIEKSFSFIDGFNLAKSNMMLCGNGIAGDLLCLWIDEDNVRPLKITLSRGKFRQKPLTFN